MLETGSEEEAKETSGPSFGTWPFQAPECFGAKQQEDYAIDVWAAGVTLFSLVFGKLPFKGKNFGELKNAIQNK
jgi:[calcium/calmodulin-dependent protein kinase] kinase